MSGVEEEVNIEETEQSSDGDNVVMAGTEEEATKSGCLNSESSDELEEDVVLAGTEEMTAHILPDHPFLVGLRRHLMSRHGKGRSEREAKTISSEVAKFLQFSSPTLDPSNLYNVEKLDGYLKSLEGQGKAATTQHAILCRVKQGLAYVDLSLEPEETLKAEKCRKFIANWLATLGKEARRVKRSHLEDISDKAAGATHLSEIERFSRSNTMITSLHNAVEKAKKGKKIPQVDIRQIMLWLAGSLLHLNAQRPGAVTHATLEEYRAATVSTIDHESYTTILVENHKTATTGRARLTSGHRVTKLLDLFVTQLRPLLEGSTSELLFPNRDGNPIDHLSRHVAKLATKLGYQLSLTATETRHAAATTVAGSSYEERSAVAAAMSHSQRTQHLYYTLKKGKKDAVEGYRVLEGVRREEESRGVGGTRVRFTSEDEEVLLEYFAQHISSRKPPSSDECRQFLQQHPLNRDHKQIRDKVRNLIGR